jgi:hypothetical protein
MVLAEPRHDKNILKLEYLEEMTKVDIKSSVL